MELSLFHPADFATADIRRGLEENGLECTICSVLTGGINMISDDAAVRKQTRVHMADAFRRRRSGSEDHCRAFVFAGGYLPGRRRTADEWKWAVECYQSLGPVLSEYKVTIALEPLNRFETYFLNTAADAVKLAAKRSIIQTWAFSSIPSTPTSRRRISAQAYRTVGRHLKHVHTCENDRGIPGSGHVGVAWSSQRAQRRSSTPRAADPGIPRSFSQV